MKRHSLANFLALALLTSCSAQTNLQSSAPHGVRVVPNSISFRPRPWIGVQALDPLDTSQTHALQRQLNPSYVRMAIDWSLASTNWSRYDAMFALNTNCNIILLYYGTNVLAESNALVATIARYTNAIWGVDAFNEPDGNLGSVTNYVPYVTMVRYVINHAGYAGKIRLLGPSTANSWIDGYASNLRALGVLSKFDVIAAHDYFACPGNGACTNAGPYTHPNDSPGVGYPNLAGRIQNMQYWAAQAGAANVVVLEEYGLYSGNTNDAFTTAQIAATNNCVLILNDPQGPIGLCPWNNAEPDTTWSPAIRQLLSF
jgi:hypothetical protein